MSREPEEQRRCRGDAEERQRRRGGERERERVFGFFYWFVCLVDSYTEPSESERTSEYFLT